MRLLIVEDDAQLGEALVAALRGQGNAVDWFRDGAAADAALAGAAFDAMLLDLGLPGADGLTWLQRWRARGVDLPVLVLTARDGTEHRIAGLDGGADDYLVKPIAAEEIAARLRALLRRAGGRAQPVWTHGALSYDPSARTVTWNGQPVELRAREIALLDLFLRHPQRVLSKAQIQDKLYDWSGAEPESNTLEVYVYQLRKKIHPGIVRTVRGVGYALGAAEQAP